MPCLVFLASCSVCDCGGEGGSFVCCGGRAWCCVSVRKSRQRQYKHYSVCVYYTSFSSWWAGSRFCFL